MSLLEDVFLQDEAGEAQELERIIEGDEYDERPRSRASNSDDNSEKEDEAEEDKRRVDPTQAKPKRIVKNPRFILNPARLTGPRGIQVLPEHFKDFKFKGKGHERDDLDLILKKLEHWAYRLYPKFQFEDCLKKIETLGKKRPVMVHLQKIRSDQFTSEETVVQKESSDEEAAPQQEDEFDKLLQQQITLARAAPSPAPAPPTPAPLARTPVFSTPVAERLSQPKATSSPSINDEQRERMLKNRRLAEEKRLARLKQHSLQETTIPEEPKTPENVPKKHNKSNVIDSSDEEESVTINQCVTVDIHGTTENNYDGNETSDIVADNDARIQTNDSEISNLGNNQVVEENNSFIGVNKDVIDENNVTNKDDVATSNLELNDNVEVTDQSVSNNDNGASVVTDAVDEVMDVEFDDDF